jgi:secondary thiamine-phosphate synthase enzyme
MRQAQTTLTVATRGRGFTDITGEVAAWVARQRVGTGLLTLFVQHTSASLLVQENADADVLADLQSFLARLAPDDPSLYRHTTEGADDMPAHIRSALTATQLSVPVQAGRMALGTWQAIYLVEHRLAAHRRSIVLHLAGE